MLANLNPGRKWNHTVLLAALAALTAMVMLVVGIGPPAASLASSRGPQIMAPLQGTPTATPTICSSGWNVVASPNGASNPNVLFAVAAVSANDVWAVGYSGAIFGLSQTLIEHWDGTSWSVVPSPSPGSEANILRSITVVSPNDIWAVGNYNMVGNTPQTLIEHWDGTSWTVEASPSPRDRNYLYGVAAVSADDVWAVGWYFDGGEVADTLIEHWDGTSWSVVPSPNGGSYVDTLWGVAAVSADDVWAVGHYSEIDGIERTLVERWNGTSWSVVPSPDIGGLKAVAAISTNYVWAVGGSQILRWNGSIWSVVSSPNIGTLSGVAAASADDAWAVGYNASMTVVEHWNGSSWSVVPSPNPGSSNTLRAVAALSASDAWAVGTTTSGSATNTLIERYISTCATSTPIATSTATSTPIPPTFTPQATPTCSPGGGPYDIAIVYSDDGPPGKLIDYIEAEPDVDSVIHIEARFSTPTLAQLLPYDVVVLFSNIEYDDPVAMGNVIADYQDAGGIVVAKNANWYGPPYGLEGRWMTGGYTMFNYPAAPRNSTDTLGAYDPTHPLMQGVLTMTAFFRNEVTLTAGASQVAAWSDGLPLVAHKTTNGHTAVGINALLGFPEEGWDGDFGTVIVNSARWLRPGVPCGSVTPQATATRTATATQPPQTGTPTPCPMTFTDVLPTDFFYVPVRYLYCAGVISGYADNTFRPYNTTTRGQLTKIVVLGFGIAIYTPPQPTFTDVPATHTFYQYIETAAFEGIVSGYSDGSFRPGNDVTRGQLSKIVVVAAQWPLVNPPTPTFTDVPTSHTFYTYIETAYDHEIISGYADGTFRPGNNATRGQISKIVYNAVIQP